MERLQSLPTWLRILFATLPILICIPILCIAVYAYQQFNTLQLATATAAGQQTRQALELTDQAIDAQNQAATFAAQVTEQANVAASQTALAVQLALTQTALVPPTDTPILSPLPPSETPTLEATFAPRTVTITLRECRGDNGTVFFGEAPPQALEAFKSISFTVPPGKYVLRIDWKRNPANNVSQEFEFTSSRTLPLGDQCK
jgi:hypothetical protein